jgi:hypothetical protein
VEGFLTCGVGLWLMSGGGGGGTHPGPYSSNTGIEITLNSEGTDGGGGYIVQDRETAWAH